MRANNDCPWSIVVAEDCRLLFQPFSDFRTILLHAEQAMDDGEGGWRMERNSIIQIHSEWFGGREDDWLAHSYLRTSEYYSFQMD